MNSIRRRGRATVVALAFTGVERVYGTVVAQWQNSLAERIQAGDVVPQERLNLSDALTGLGAIANLILLVVTGILFLRWIHGATRQTRDFGELLGFTPGGAVWSFIIPVISLYRPYRVVRDLHDSLEPDRLPEPTLTAIADESTGYREVHFTAPPPPPRLPHAFLGAWWAAFVISNLLGQIVFRMDGTSLGDIVLRNNISTASNIADIVGVALAITVVNGISGRLSERFRRLRHNSPEVLRENGVELVESL